MSAQTTIQWTDRTWNPTRGCSRVGPECDNCYAMRVAHRFSKQVNGKPGPYKGLTVLRPEGSKRPGVDWSGRVAFVPSALEEPLRWRKPARVFVNSMSDLFHESLQPDDIAAIFGVMAACPQHTFQVLTKRPERARSWFEWLQSEPLSEREGEAETCIGEAYAHAQGNSPLLNATRPDWPLPNLWLGVSVGNKRDGLPRINELRHIPAAVRFLSIEPLLEDLGPLDLTGIDWVIVGGESGNGARPCALEWIESIVEQCRAAEVACFVKQLGKFVVSESRACKTDEEAKRDFGFGSRWLWRAGLTDRKGGDINEWPEHLQVREFPQ